MRFRDHLAWLLHEARKHGPEEHITYGILEARELCETPQDSAILHAVICQVQRIICYYHPRAIRARGKI